MRLETVLETERLRLTNWQPGHVDNLLALHGDPEVTRYFSRDGKPEGPVEIRQRLELWANLFATRRMGKLRMTDRHTGAFLGRAGFGTFGPDNVPELGYAILREHWGKGFASEAAAALRDWFFRQTQENGFIGLADIRNTASIHILHKIGMTPTHIAQMDDGFVCQFHKLTREQWHDR